MDELYTPQEVANKLKVSLRTIYRMIDGGRLKAVKVGYFWRIPKSEVERIITDGIEL